MLSRIDSGETGASAQLLHGALGADPNEPIVPAASDAEFDSGTQLPRDHPKWVRDTLTVSQRARDLIARLRPIALAVLSFWDHRSRSAVVAGSRLCIDASGSYHIQ
jgi:hypothetical protein